MATYLDPMTYPVTFDPPSAIANGALHVSAITNCVLSLLGSAYIVFCTFFLMGEAVMTVVMALSLFMAVQFDWPLYYGQYDWILISLTLGVPALGVLLFNALDGLGPDLYFCFFNTSNQNGVDILGAIGIFCLACFILPCFLYTLIFKKVYAVRSHTASAVGNIAKANNPAAAASSSPVSGGGGGLADRVQRAVIIKTSRYVAIIVATFVPMAVYGIMVGVAKTERYGGIFFLVSTVNAGGSVNTVAFLYQRHLARRELARKGSTSSQTPAREARSSVASTV
ncbi:hypothetical protein DFJ73DRAFT_780282 [Zopfochytrium polystomum]|nr:hypothetical protein DFJ73DRAFT_780282 [Zopfochytrium polystomum]